MPADLVATHVLAVGPDAVDAVFAGEDVVAGFADGRLERWDPARGKIAAIDAEGDGAVVSMSAAGTRLAVLHERSLVMRRGASLALLARHRLASRLARLELAKPQRLWDRVRPLVVALDPKKARALVGLSSIKSHVVIDTRTGKRLAAGTFGEFEEACAAVAWSPDGKTFAAGATADGDYYVDVYVYRAKDYEILGVASRHCLHVSSLAYSPDSKRIARASREYEYSHNGESLLTFAVPETPRDRIEETPIDEAASVHQGEGFWAHREGVKARHLAVRFAGVDRLVALCGDGSVRLYSDVEIASLDVGRDARALFGEGSRFGAITADAIRLFEVRSPQ